MLHRLVRLRQLPQAVQHLANDEQSTTLQSRQMLPPERSTTGRHRLAPGLRLRRGRLLRVPISRPLQQNAVGEGDGHEPGKHLHARLQLALEGDADEGEGEGEEGAVGQEGGLETTTTMTTTRWISVRTRATAPRTVAPRPIPTSRTRPRRLGPHRGGELGRPRKRTICSDRPEARRREENRRRRHPPSRTRLRLRSRRLWSSGTMSTRRR